MWLVTPQHVPLTIASSSACILAYVRVLATLDEQDTLHPGKVDQQDVFQVTKLLEALGNAFHKQHGSRDRTGF